MDSPLSTAPTASRDKVLTTGDGQRSAIRLTFTGSGSEYFGIWVVNLLLTIITLGIYSAWAKVRKSNYFYDNTHLAGSSFAYHGKPIAILKGRIIALLLIATYQFAFKINLVLGCAALAVMLALMPWLIWKSLQFKLHNSSYRGIRFSFRGSLRQSYHIYLLMPLVALLSLGFVMPLAHQRAKKFQHGESRFGSTFFSFKATVGSFYRIYGVASLMMLGFFVLGAVVGTVGASGVGMMPLPVKLAMGTLFGLAFYVVLFLVMAVMGSMLQNLIWRHTHLGSIGFDCRLKWHRMVWLYLTNLLGIALTLGLYTPFAQIRMLKYRIESISLGSRADLDSFVAQAASAGGTIGEGAADLLDFDIAL